MPMVLAARACKEDATKLCEGKSDAQSPGIVVHCLRYDPEHRFMMGDKSS
jgi:hypothetical protein